MAINFSDTITAIHADLNKRSSSLIIILILLLLSWVAWLAFMPLIIVKQVQGIVITDPIQLPKSTENTGLQNTQQVKLLIRLSNVNNFFRVGYSAILDINHQLGEQHKGLSAIVAYIGKPKVNDQVEVGFELDSNAGQISLLESGAEVSVRVFIPKVTPWQLLMHSLGQELGQY